jgi:hypothetical protein
MSRFAFGNGDSRQIAEKLLVQLRTINQTFLQDLYSYNLELLTFSQYSYCNLSNTGTI